MAEPDRLGGRLARLAALLAVLAVAAPSRAAAADSVGVNIGVVLASNAEKAVDPALSSIRTKLQSMFNYASYRLIDRVGKTLSIGETGDFPLPGRRSIRVSPVAAPGGKIRLAIQIMEGSRNLLTTTTVLNRGGMFLVGGPSHENGVLILIISAE